MKTHAKIYYLGVAFLTIGAVLTDCGVHATGATMLSIGILTCLGNAFDCFGYSA